MCVNPFRRPSPTPIAAPAPIQPRQPDIVQASRLPSKKELLDPEDVAGVEYGTSAKKDELDARGGAARVGTSALKINLNPTGGTSGSTGGLNV